MTAEHSSSVLVLGSANMDLVVRQETHTAPGHTVFGRSFSTVPGGKGLNQAVAAARMGATVEFAGAVGDDAFGETLLELLQGEGIGVAGLVRAGLPTGTAHITVVDSGENSITVISGANQTVAALSPGQRELVAAAAFLVMQCELPLSVLEEATALARASGATTVLTPAPVRDLPDSLLRAIDYLVPNEHEALALAGEKTVEDAARRLSERVGTVIVTLGEAGVLVARGGEVTDSYPARRVTPVDTTGAGDTFVGALVAELSRGGPLHDAITVATHAASVSVTRPGATSSMPRREELAEG